MDSIETRSLFPVTTHCIYLNNAAESPLNNAVWAKLEEYIESASCTPHKKQSPREQLRTQLATILGGLADDYALIPSTAMGIGTVAAGFPWRAGDNVVLPGGEHWSNTFPWLLLQERGVQLRIVQPGKDHRIDPGEIQKAVDNKTRILACAAVRFNSGFRANLRALSAIAHANGALFLVDAIQAAGACPINVVDDGIDIMAGAGFKWLLGMHGTGYLYLNERARSMVQAVLPGMFAAEDNLDELRWLAGSRKYESGTLPYALFHAWTAGLEVVQSIGVDSIYKRNLELSARIIDGLTASGLSVLSPHNKESERSAIVVADSGDAQRNKAIHQTLLDEAIITTFRAGVLRISPNFYNTESEIDQFLNAVRAAV